MRVLVVDDDRVLADVLAFTLRREGFEVIQAFDGPQALQRWDESRPDLIVLDVNLPQIDGFTVCRRIREQADTPIILLTVRSDEDDIVRGLGLGADDYMTKPFSPRQLVARAQAVLRRVGKMAAPVVHTLGPLTFDPGRRELQMVADQIVSLTPLENRLLSYLALNLGHILTIEAIIEQVWGAEGGDRDMLRQLVRRLRSKISQAAAAAGAPNPPYIETIPALGYGLIVPGSME